MINLPINTIKTAGIAIPINGTKIEGKTLDKSDGIVILNIFNYFSIFFRNSVNFIT